MIISVGYRVKSQRGIQFRIWAANIIKEYMKKGFAMDDNRLKKLGGGGYFKELLERIRDIRATEKVIEPFKIIEVTDAGTTDIITRIGVAVQATYSDAEENDGAIIIREEVNLERTEPVESEVVIDTSDISITEGKTENEFIVDYADAYTDIPTTGSSKVIAGGAFAAVCTALIGVIVTKKRAQ